VKAADHTCAAAAGQPGRLPTRQDQCILRMQVVLLSCPATSDSEPGPCPRCHRTIPLPRKANKTCETVPTGPSHSIAAICSRAKPRSKSNTGANCTACKSLVRAT